MSYILAPVPVAQENKRNVIKWMEDTQYRREQVFEDANARCKMLIRLLY